MAPSDNPTSNPFRASTGGGAGTVPPASMTPGPAAKPPAAVSQGGWGPGRVILAMFKTVVAVSVTMLAGIGLLLVVALVGLTMGLKELREATPIAPSMPDSIVLSMALTKPLAETRLSSGLSGLLDKNPTVTEFVRTLDAAGKDPRVKGLIMRIEPVPMSLATVQEMRDAIQRFRKTGKFARAFSLSLGDFTGGTGPYYLASAFDQIWLQPIGSLALTGIGMELPFAAKLLHRFHINFEAITREEYKSAMAHFTDEHISAPQKQAMDEMLDDMFGQLVDDIAKARNLDADTVRALIDKAPLSADSALEAGLIDHVGYRDEFLKDLPDTAVSLIRYYRQVEAKPAHGNGIALIEAAGPIVQGADRESAVLGGVMRIQQVVDALNDAAEDPDIIAVVLRLDSPGGSPAASEYVRHAVEQVKDAGKPVVVSMGRVAASGGYWIASGAGTLVAEPGTITGSIGVVSGKPDLSGFWAAYDVNWAELMRGENAGLSSSNQPFSKHGLATANQQIDGLYHQFLERVAESRGFSVEEARALAKGRVWTGRQAFQIGLVDALGGLDVAFDKAAAAAGTTTDKAVLVRYPETGNRIETAIQLLNELGGITQGLGTLSKLSTLAEQSGVPALVDALQQTEPAARLPLGAEPLPN